VSNDLRRLIAHRYFVAIAASSRIETLARSNAFLSSVCGRWLDGATWIEEHLRGLAPPDDAIFDDSELSRRRDSTLPSDAASSDAGRSIRGRRPSSADDAKAASKRATRSETASTEAGARTPPSSATARLEDTDRRRRRPPIVPEAPGSKPTDFDSNVPSAEARSSARESGDEPDDRTGDRELAADLDIVDEAWGPLPGWRASGADLKKRVPDPRSAEARVDPRHARRSIAAETPLRASARDPSREPGSPSADPAWRKRAEKEWRRRGF
jgi:hypothetical protein